MEKKPDLEDRRISIPQKNVAKFKEVFLSILSKVGAKPNVGKTVIYKLLYFIDFDYYELHEEQLMGLEYIKNTYGPTPLDFEEMCAEMISAGEIEKIESDFFRKHQTKYLPHGEPNLNVLSATELRIIEQFRLGRENSLDTRKNQYN